MIFTQSMQSTNYNHARMLGLLVMKSHLANKSYHKSFEYLFQLYSQFQEKITGSPYIAIYLLR